jgi:hypothetical protein
MELTDLADIGTVAAAVEATALAVCVFGLAYVAKTLREWWTWRK